MGQCLQSPTSPLLFVSRNYLASGSLLHRYMYWENYRGTAHRWLLCSLYRYHQSKQGKQKSSAQELEANQCLESDRQTDSFHCDCWGEKMYTFGWDLLLCFECRQTVKPVCTAKLVSTMASWWKQFGSLNQHAFFLSLFRMTASKCHPYQSGGGTLSEMISRYATKNNFVLPPILFCAHVSSSFERPYYW